MSVPAWKRLGLKLKSAASQPSGTTSARTTSSAPDGASHKPDFNSPRRKRPNDNDEPAAKPSSLKKPRRDEPDLDISGQDAYQKRKSVTFAQDPKATTDKPAARGNAKEKTTPKKTKLKPKEKKQKKKKKKKPAAKKSEKDSNPTISTEETLQYLRRWKTSRDTWKFSKNHQSHLIKNAFDPNLLPAADVGLFYEYIRDLKGLARKRLREDAEEVRKGDKFPEGTKDVEAKEKQYEEIMSGLLRPGQGGSKRKHYNEMEFDTSNRDGAVTSRVVKRIRAETVMEELMESEPATNPSETPASVPATVTADAAGARVTTVNDGTNRPAKRIRASKRRTVDADSSSSSDSSDSESDESDSGGSSGSSSSSDDSDDDSDDEMDLNGGIGNAETSSSSSSSSDEAGEEDSEDDEDSGSE